MADFDQSQQELDNFLEQTFSQPAEQPKQGTQPQIPPTTQVEQEGITDELSEYLTGETASEEPGVNTQEEQTPPPARPEQPGQAEADRVLALERELAATRARAEIYERALQTGARGQQEPPQEEKPSTVFAGEELDIDERYLSDYGDAGPLIQNIARKVANDLYARAVQPLQQQLATVTTQLEAQRGINDQNQRFSLETQLRNAVPDLDSIAYSPEWQSYIKQPAPYTGGTYTIAQVVQSGIQSGNMKQVVEVIDDFKRKRQQSQPQTQQVAPGRAQTTQPTTAPRGQKMLRMSDFERATANFQAGKLSWDKYQIIADEFNAAMLEGRVITNR